MNYFKLPTLLDEPIRCKLGPNGFLFSPRAYQQFGMPSPGITVWRFSPKAPPFSLKWLQTNGGHTDGSRGQPDPLNEPLAGGGSLNDAIEEELKAARIKAKNLRMLEHSGDIAPGCFSCRPVYDSPKGTITTFGPPHKASSRCESGGYDHCSCDTCF